MPTYCFSTPDGVVHERVFSMADVPDSIDVDGQLADRDVAAEHGGFRDSPGNWPLHCSASGVDPTQAGAASDIMARHGCPTEFTSSGEAIYTDQTHRRKALKFLGLHDRDGGYGDG